VPVGARNRPAENRNHRAEPDPVNHPSSEKKRNESGAAPPRSKEAFLKRTVIVVLLALAATAAGALARQVKDGGDIENVKTFDVTASRFLFEPATITVVKGDSVRLRLQSADRPHAFAIKAFRVKTLIPKVGEAVTVEFVADQAGVFEFTCAEYCGTGHAGMKGRLVVLAREK
jgi:heme/copper-type cytochrome/quinol oxidase subunit 2